MKIEDTDFYKAHDKAAKKMVETMESAHGFKCEHCDKISAECDDWVVDEDGLWFCPTCWNARVLDEQGAIK